MLLPITRNAPNPIIYEQITAEIIIKCCKQLSGSGGPTLIDADTWKHIVCSRAYGNHPTHLAEALAGMAKRLCSEEIPFCILQEYTAGRLIPLDKGADNSGNPGIRPIGIGEVLRRIVGKAVMTILKTDIQSACGCLQTCTGLRSGIEATIHASNEIWQDQSTQCILQVDADNAFNRLNRKVALHNIQQTCPAMHRFLQNHYQQPSKLTFSDGCQEDSIQSEEGCTQGDPVAMAFYAAGSKPLIDNLAEVVNQEECKQSWFADDSSAAGKLREVRLWWETLTMLGPKYGYFPKPSKTVLILKDPSLYDLAATLFADTGITITSQGERHLGAVIGKEEFRNQYVSKKITKWCEDITELAEVAKIEPQIALSIFTKSICHRWSYVQRTIENTSALFSPLEDALRNIFIPSLLGRPVSDLERKILSLPVRYGGLGIANPEEVASREYAASKRVTHNLTQLIVQQEQDLSCLDLQGTVNTIKDLKREKDSFLDGKFNTILENVNCDLKRCLELNKEKGAGSWLTVLPLQDHGYCLNKQEFRDAICLRYGWKIPNTPPFCGCGAANGVNHTLICRKGGYVFMRHNALRELNAEMQREVCRDVVVEPKLLLVRGESISGTTADGAGPDISSRGMWSTFERTFFDVRVMHPNAPSYKSSSPSTLYAKHEREKIVKYNNRVLTVEKGSFTPLVYSTFGGWAPQAVRYHKRLAELVANKRNENYKDVINHMRTRVRFALLRSVLISIRGERGKKYPARPMASVAFNMVPEAMQYESF